MDYPINLDAVLQRTTDIAIIGAGICGLAHALAAARRGHAVTVFERHGRALGASVRNFGMVLPLGMAPGVMLERALRTRAAWMQLAGDARLWHDARGAMMVAYRDDEQRVMEEFAGWGPANGYDVAWLSTQQALAMNPALERAGLRGALWSRTDLLVDPIEAMRLLPAYLAERYGVRFEYRTAVTGISLPVVEAGGARWKAGRVVVCCGDDLETLYPQALDVHPVTKCKLQMMRTYPQPANWRLGPFLATGLSLLHYPSFAGCPSLDGLRARVADESPELIRRGIHVLAAQHTDGGLVVGDSHEYGDDVDPFDRPEVDALILDRLTAFLRPPVLDIAARWHGVYARTAAGAPLVLAPAPDVRIVTGLGGAGMSTGFALAQDVFDAWE